MEEFGKKSLRLEELSSSELQITGGGVNWAKVLELVQKTKDYINDIIDAIPDFLNGLKKGFSPTLSNA